MEPAICYRAHTPEWASMPTSGAGAAKNGGRWNARSRPALYLSFDPLTAVKETNQQILDFIPITLVRYQVSGGMIADYDDANLRKKHALADNLMSQPWWGPQFAELLSPTQQAAEQLIAAGLDGLIYQSTQAAGHNLVLWHWNEIGGASVVAEDKHGLLPKNRDSWR
ncbi:RES family NAD+ phosphorylase [Blastomonas sp.]|uniref:RES family NAD+ phosphorylase n=1 Tax=Blastomonas sp. TaxID=1909299 RepID=UPI00359303C5